MGLDNGIELRIKDKAAFGEVPDWVRYEPWEEKSGCDYEIFYWRKCWNVRGEILAYLGANRDEFEWNLDINDLVAICKILKPMYTKKGWDEGRSIWTWDKYIKRAFKGDLKYAKKIAKWLKKKPEGSYQLYFYDSY